MDRLQRRVDYRIMADTDSTLSLARSIDDKSTWIPIAPMHIPLMGSMEWKTANHLLIPARSRAGCVWRIDDITIEWNPR